MVVGVLGTALLAAGGLGLVGAGPVAAEGNDFTATCQADGTYLVVVIYDTFVADSTIVGGAATLSNAFVGSVPMSPTHLANVGDVAQGSTSIPGTTSGSLQIVVQLDSPNGSSSGSTTLPLAGDCVPAVAEPVVTDPGSTTAPTPAETEPPQVATAVVAAPRTAG
jgi:hypothetical protein